MSLSIKQVYQSAIENYQSGNLIQAEKICRQILHEDPENANAIQLLGLIAAQGGKDELAIQYIKQAIQINSNFAQFYINLGYVQQMSGRFEDAVASYRKALSLNHDLPETLNNLGLVLKELGQTEEAIASYKKSVSLKPDNAIFCNNLGAALQESGRLNEAEKNLNKALALKPDFVEAYCNLGIVYRDQCRLDEAIASFRKALVLKPGFNFAHSNLVFAMNYSPAISQREIFNDSLVFAKSLIRNVRPNKQIAPDYDISERKLRICYMSPDFRKHSAAYFFESLLRAHNREDFEIYCYSDVENPDEVTGRIQDMSDHWVSIFGKKDADVVDCLINDRIDILVELAGHTRKNRLPMLASKPAPVQVSWLGYPNTTGLQEIDYRITDAVADPEGKDDEYYTEELVRLPDCFLCYKPYDHAPEVSAPPCLESDTITFGSFNMLAKVTGEVVGVWAEILNQVPNSRIILKAKQLNDASVRKRYIKRFEELGVYSDRLELLGMTEEIVDHFLTYNRVDIALDPFPYNGTTTTCEALWMGVPVVTLRGGRHSGRVGASILHTLGMADLLVADSKNSYIEKAVTLAKDTAQLVTIRKELRQQVQDSPLCDAELFASNVEEAYRKMWEQVTKDSVQNIQKESQKFNRIQLFPKPKKAFLQPKPKSFSFDNTYQSAVQHVQAGNLQQAEQLCQQILNVDKNNANGNHLLGVIVLQQGGKNDTAIQLIQKSLSINPGNPEAHNNLGIAFKGAGKLKDAIACFRKALSLKPDYAGAHNNLGNAFQDSNRQKEAIACFRKALSLKPDDAEAHNNLGIVYKESGREEEAIACFRKVLSLKPDNAEAHNNLGIALKGAGKLNEAIVCFRKALSLKPNYAEAHNNLGNAFQDSNRQKDAIASYRKALSLKPDFAEAYNSLGILFKDSGNLKDATTCYKKAISLKPDFAVAHNSLGILFKGSGNLKDAIACFRKAISLKPDFAEAHNNLGNVFKDSGRQAEAITCFRKALSLKPDFAEAHNNLGNVFKESGNLDDAITCFRKALSLNTGFNFAHSNLLFVMNYSPKISQEEIFEESLVFAKTHAPDENRSKYFHSPGAAVKRKLRIGYISPDFRGHSVAHFFEPLLKAHNREYFEIYCYSDVLRVDMVTKRIQEEADQWLIIIGKSNDEVFSQIKKDQIDILVELTGHTANNRLLLMAQKPAPIQVSWLGYPNTTGLNEIDYRFTDTIADPVGEGDNLNSEGLIRLEGGFLSYQAYEYSPEVSAPPCLSNDTITFGSFNNLAKVTPDVVKVWAKILLKVENSILVLKAKQLIDEFTGNRYKEMFLREGVSSDRIELLGRVPNMVNHLKTYNRIDIAFDPFPYNGTTTTCEALWMGVPVVTLSGKRHSCRVGASIMHAVGMADLLVADSIDMYIMKVVSLANDIKQLGSIRKNLREQVKDSPLCDAASFAKNIEDAYMNMWVKYTGSYIEEEQ